MAVMLLALRSPLAALAPLLLLVPSAALSGGCSAADDVEDSGPTVTATGPKETTTAPAGAKSDPTEGSTATPSEQSDAVVAVCGPYIEMARAINNAAFSGAGPEEIAAAIAPRLKEFAARVPDLERPPGLSAATWRGVEALAERILALPDHPSNAEIEAVEDQLSEQERDAFDDAARWLRTNCSL